MFTILAILPVNTDIFLELLALVEPAVNRPFLLFSVKTDFESKFPRSYSRISKRKYLKV